MIRTRVGNVLDVKTGVIVHGCNCHGVMGAGIAAAIRNRWPKEVYEPYRDKYIRDGLTLGDVMFCQVGPQKWIVNANTQQSTGGRRAVSYDAITECFEAIAAHLAALPAYGRHIYFPMIGAGLGGGDWEIIRKIIDRTVPDNFAKKTLYVLEQPK